MSELEQALDVKFEALCIKAVDAPGMDFGYEVSNIVLSETGQALTAQEQLLFVDWRDVLEEPGTDWKDLMRWLWSKIKDFIDWLTDLLD